LWKQGETFTIEVNIILLGLTLTKHIVDHVMDIKEVHTRHLVGFPTMGGLIRRKTLTTKLHME